MSERNVELARRVVEAFNARDPGAIIALCDPDIELHSMLTALDSTVYQGHDGVRRWDGAVKDAFGDEIRVEAEAYFNLGEHILAFYIMRGRGRLSGAEVTMSSLASVGRWREGLLVYLKMYVEREDALSDLGVSKAELEPIEP
jgi:SnoaL-like domain